STKQASSDDLRSMPGSEICSGTLSGVAATRTIFMTMHSPTIALLQARRLFNTSREIESRMLSRSPHSVQLHRARPLLPCRGGLAVPETIGAKDCSCDPRLGSAN